jgi:hypothetical protein
MSSARSVLAVAAVALVMVGCGESGPGDEVTTAENVVVLDDVAEITSVTVAPEGLTLVTTADVGIATGDIVVGRAGPGYLRRVTAIDQVSATEVYLHTDYASLSEAIENGTAFQSFSFSSDRSTNRSRVPVVDLSGRVLYDGDVGGVPLKVTITTGSIDLKYDYDFDIDIGFFRIDKFEAVAVGSLDGVIDIAIEAGGPIDFRHELDLGGPGPFFVQDIDFNIGPIPVRGSIAIDFLAGFAIRGEAEGTLTTGAEASAALRVGAHYVRGDGWGLIWDPDLSYGRHPVVWTADADIDVTAWVRPIIKTSFYGNPGPGLDLKKVFRTKIEKSLGGEFSKPAEGNNATDGPLHKSAAPENFIQTVCLTGELNYQVRIFGFDLANFTAHLPCDESIIDEAGTVNDDPPPGGDEEIDPTEADAACADSFGEGWQACPDDDRCIYNTWVCDQIPDCPDATDEVDCEDPDPDPPGPTCEEQFGEGWTSCPTDGQCVHSTWFCDLIPDCPDGEDEDFDAEGNPC